ncbi:MAG: hypothetical protein ACOX0W_06725 [Sphaerochaetaceae bacterium]|jgi:hypothetical protein
MNLQKNKHISTLLMITLLIIITSCVTFRDQGNNPPAWLDHPYDASYPQQKFLMSVGSGVDRESALSQAYSSLANIFHTSVSSQLYSSSLTYDDAYSSYTVDQLIDQATLHSALQDIVGSEVVHMYTDANQRVWVHLALDKSKALAHYTQQAKEVEQAIQRITLASLNSREAIEKYILLVETLPLYDHLEILHQYMSVLGQSAPPSTKSKVLGEIASLASQISVSIEINVSGTFDPTTEKQLITHLSTYLTQKGFRFLSLDTVEATHLYLSFTGEFTTPVNSPLHHYVSYIAFDLYHKEKIVASGATTYRSTGVNESDALIKALRSLEKEIPLLFESLFHQ